MKKISDKGFMLAETLIVTTFVAGVLIFIFIQFTSLSDKYDDTYKYNTVEGIYALEDIKNYIEDDTVFFDYIKNELDAISFIDITNCSLFTNSEYCSKLFNLQNIERIIVLKNKSSYKNLTGLSEEMMSFALQISNEGNEKYRLIAKFKNSTFATMRFGG